MKALEYYYSFMFSIIQQKNRIEFLREFESIFKAALAHESGDPGVPFKEKKPRVENLVRLSL
jgi:hypothetical protein